MARGDLTERQWTHLEPLLPSSKGKRGGQCRDHRQVTGGIRGCCAPGRDGPTSRRAMDRTRPAMIALCVGRGMVPGSGSSRPCKRGKRRRAATGRPRSTAASFVRISTRQGPRSRQSKGGSSSTGPGARTQPRRLQHQASRKRRRQRAPALHCCYCGAAARQHAGRAGARRHCGALAPRTHSQAPEAAAGGSGLQLSEDSPASASSQDSACHPGAEGPEEGAQSERIGRRAPARL